jgi:hypothetical protein
MTKLEYALEAIVAFALIFGGACLIGFASTIGG